MPMNDGRPKLGAVGDDRIDRAIDRAVRAMIQIDPPAGLRRRVLSRLDAPLRAPFLPRFAFAAAALAVLVIAIMVIRRGGPGDTTGTPASIRAGTPASVPHAVPSPPTTRAPEGGRAETNPPGQSPISPTAPPKRPLRGKLIEMPPVAKIFWPPTGRI